MVTRGTNYLWRLGSDDDPTDPTGCFLEHGGKYAVAPWVAGKKTWLVVKDIGDEKLSKIYRDYKKLI